MFLIYFIIFLAGFSEGIMDKLQFHFYKSIFKNFKKTIFWNPEISWKNKYKNNDPLNGPKFIFSTSLLVSLTDAWHLFKLVRNILLFISLSFIGFLCEDFKDLLIAIVLSRVIYGIGFWISYNKILVSK